MSEYIHSGVAGKINRIVKPHIGNILVTSEFGNAKESTLTEDVLKTAVNDINRIKYAVTYKGEKATVDALPTTGNTKGDMWNVTENGHNYAWTGSEWDDLGGTVSNGNDVTDWKWDANYTPFSNRNFLNSTSTSLFEVDPTNPSSAPITKALCIALNCSEASDDILTQDKHVKVTVEIQTDSTVQTIYGDICAFDSQGFGNLTILIYPDHGSYMLFLRADHALYNGDNDTETKSWFSGPTISILNVENFYIKSVTLSASAVNGHNIGGNYRVSYLLGN